MKNIIVVIVFIFSGVLTNKLVAQSKTELTICVYQSGDKGYNKIIVIDNDSIIEEVDLLPFTHRDLTSYLIETNKLLNKYRLTGFKIVSELRGSTSAPLNGFTVMVTTYRLEK